MRLMALHQRATSLPKVWTSLLSKKQWMPTSRRRS